MAFPFLLLALVVVGMVGMMLLMPKPKQENARPETLDKLNFPTASEGSPLPLILGKVRHRGPNTLWYGDFKSVPIKKKVKTGLFSSKKVIVGYRYYVGIDLGLGLGPGVVLSRIWFDKDEVWSGSVGPGEASLTIDNPGLWGGDEKGGGFSGTLRFYGGELAQPMNAYCAAKVAPKDYLAYVGQTHIVLEQPYIGTQPQLRPMSFELARYTNGIGLDPGHNIVGEDLNPAEMLYQLKTLDWGGLDVDPNDIDLPSFREVGETLYYEGNGMSLIISSPNSGRDAVEEVLRQIDGIEYQDPVTGKIILRLIRPDYDVADLPTLDKTNIVGVRSFARTSWDDTVNQVRVNFTNRSNKYEKGSAIVQDLANINSQGRIRPTNLSYPGVTTGTLAQKLAQREMAQLSVPLFRATLEVNREAASLRPGDPFIWSWDEYGLDQVVMRVQKFSLGDLLDGRIVIECVQDKFALDLTIFAPPEPTSHVAVDRTALSLPKRLLTEVPYWMMQHQDFAAIPPSAADRTFLMAAARAPNPYHQGFTATVEQGTDALVVVDHMPFGESALLDTAFNRLAGFTTGTTTVKIYSPSNNGTWLTAGSPANGENLLAIGTEIIGFASATNNGDGTWTLNGVRRGLLDSRAVDHFAGEALFLIDADAIGEGEFVGDANATGKFQSFTDKQERPYTSADVTAITPLRRRYEKPLSPDWLLVDGSRTPGTVLAPGGPYTVTWRPRTRLSPTIRYENDAADVEEPGVTYTLRAYKNGVLIPSMTQAGLATATASVTFPYPSVGDGRIEVVAVRDGLESYEAGWIELDLAFGAIETAPIATEEGEGRITEEGEDRAAED